MTPTGRPPYVARASFIGRLVAAALDSVPPPPPDDGQDFSGFAELEDDSE